MAKRIAIACLLTLALAALGYGIYSSLLVEELRPTPTPTHKARADSSKPSPEPTVKAPRVEVVSVEGRVEKRRGDAPWTMVKTGDDIAQDEAIRTSDDGRATLDIGDLATVEISSRSEFSVRELSEKVSRARLDRGRVAAEVHGRGESAFKVESQDGQAVAETRKGQFSMLATGKGYVAVATRKGRVRLSAKNKTVEIDEGKQSVVLPEESPRAPEPIPPSLFLKVTRPRARIQRKKQTLVKGVTTPGAVVSINGVYAQTTADGRFEAEVSLREGKNRIQVEAENALGKREMTTLPAITVDTRPPKVHSDVKWGSD